MSDLYLWYVITGVKIKEQSQVWSTTALVQVKLIQVYWIFQSNLAVVVLCATFDPQTQNKMYIPGPQWCQVLLPLTGVNSSLIWIQRERRKKEEPTEDSKQAWSRLCQIILTRRAGWKPCCCRHWISGINSAGLLSFLPRLLYKPLVCAFHSAIIFPLSSFWMRMSLGESRKFIHKANKVCWEVTSDFQEETNEIFFFLSTIQPWVISAEKATQC